MLEQLPSLGVKALLELILGGLREAQKRGLDLGPVGIAPKDFAEVDRGIDQSLEMIRVIESEAEKRGFSEGVGVGQGLVFGHLRQCEECRDDLADVLQAAALVDDEEGFQRRIVALVSRHSSEVPKVG